MWRVGFVRTGAGGVEGSLIVCWVLIYMKESYISILLSFYSLSLSSLDSRSRLDLGNDPVCNRLPSSVSYFYAVQSIKVFISCVQSSTAPSQLFSSKSAFLYQSSAKATAL